MNILFHVAVGNLDRPNRWGTIGIFFTNLAFCFEKMGHNCLFFIHPAAVRPQTFNKKIISKDVYKVENFKPDKIFTWNGNNEGDEQMISLYGREKFIFGELGYFDHYKSCFFDLSGTNYLSMNIIEDLKDVPLNNVVFDNLVKRYKKPRLFKNRYVFVPLQDEGDTQIKKLSPFKKMTQLLQYVLDIYSFDDNIKILYKQHPLVVSEVIKHDKLIEVKEDVHHYLPYAENVIGINSTVMFETLLYHQRLLTIGIGVASRRFSSDDERKKFIVNCYNKQIPQNKLVDVGYVKSSWFYKEMIKNV